ncbi:MAG: hypothetical protein NZ761_06190, partial [Dehalococcoidia bacterium]|nr:hypothetical protein [Dehalococcoidia bacterium]
MVALHEIAGPADVAALPDEELLLLHLRLHQLDARLRAAGRAREYETVHRHCWVVEEMRRRGMQHRPHDPLDDETERLCGSPTALSERLRRAVVESGTVVLVPGYVWLVGSSVERADARDIDVLVREQPEHLATAWRESVLLALRRVCDPEKEGRRLHVVANPQGPHLVGGRPAIPLYDLALVPSRHPILRALTPLSAVEPQKPAMTGWTDFSDLDELWDAWGERTLAETAVAVSPKVDGFRVLLGRQGERVRAHLEDRDESVAERLTAVLEELPDGWLVDGELAALHERGWLARPQLLSFLSGKLEATPVVFLFDVLVADGEDVHALPFAERWERLRALQQRVAGSALVVLPQETARDRAGLERAARRMADWTWRDGGPPTEGVVVRRLDAPYAFGATDALAKVKKYVELKVEVVDVVRVANGYTYECALRADGGLVPLGRTFVTEERIAEVGDTLNVAVEELLLEPDGSVSWGKPRPLGVDRSRPAYTVEQAVDLARRFGVLKVYVEEQEPEDGETNAEAAQRHWDERWHEAIPVSGDALPYVLQAHVRGLTDDEAERIRSGEWGFDDVLATDRSIHFDLRLA